MIDKKNRLLELYYEQHLLATDIAKTLGVSSQYISKIIKTDTRYDEEKKSRKNINHIKKLKRAREHMKTKREIERREYIQMKKTHWRDVGKLSRMY